jgi:quinol monooxygenase YgiN
MAQSESERHEIRQLARYQVRSEALERCLAAIHEFVAYVSANESGTLRYEVWQEHEDLRHRVTIS